MATLQAPGAGSVVNLATGQTGNGVSTNVAQRRGDGVAERPAALKITTAVGATPTCTYLVEGSPDGVGWFPVAYADAATPATVVATTFVVTTAGTVWKLLPVDQPWTYLRVTMSANTNVTSTIDAFIY